MSAETHKPIVGACHCGAVTWTFSERPDAATSCNCTVCRRYGVLWAYDYVDEKIHVAGDTTAFETGLNPGVDSEANVRRHTVHGKKRRGFAIASLDDRQQHLLVLGLVYGFYVTQPPGTDGARPHRSASKCKQQDQA